MLYTCAAVSSGLRLPRPALLGPTRYAGQSGHGSEGQPNTQTGGYLYLTLSLLLFNSIPLISISLSYFLCNSLASLCIILFPLFFLTGFTYLGTGEHREVRG